MKKKGAASGLSHRVPSSLQSQWFICGSIPHTPFRSRELIKALENTTIGIAICDRNLRFAVVNRNLAKMNNIPPEEHLGKTIHEVVGSLAPTVGTRIEYVFRTGQPLNNAELVGRIGARPDSVHWLETYFPIFDDRGQVRQVGAFVMELPERHPHSGPKRVLFGFPMPTDQHISLAGNAVEHATSSKPLRASNADHSQIRSLSAREMEVLLLLANGASVKEASSNLAISPKTVETYKTRLMLKLNATSLAHLIHYAIRHHLIDVQD